MEIVLLDYNMGRFNGVDVIRLLKEKGFEGQIIGFTRKSENNEY